jgi:hypothetical protein
MAVIGCNISCPYSLFSRRKVDEMAAEGWLNRIDLEHGVFSICKHVPMGHMMSKCAPVAEILMMSLHCSLTVSSLHSLYLLCTW